MINIFTDIEAWTPRFHQCMFSLLNNTESILKHFEKAKQNFKIDFPLETAEIEFNQLTRDILDKCFLDDLFGDIQELSESGQMIDSDEHIEIKWSDIISERWFKTEDGKHVEMVVNLVGDFLTNMYDAGIAPRFHQELELSLKHFLITSYLQQMFNKDRIQNFYC